MGRLILVRHGETESNASGIAQGRSDIPLSSRGLFQAELIGEYLEQNYAIDQVVASDRRRCIETARWIDVPKTTNPSLREIDFGHWEGQKWSDIKVKYPEMYNKALTGDPTFAPPGGEPKSSFIDRVEQTIDDEGLRTSAQTIAIVAHDGVLKTLLTSLLGWPVDSSSKLTLFVGSISSITTDVDDAKLELLNFHEHLGPSYSEISDGVHLAESTVTDSGSDSN